MKKILIALIIVAVVYFLFFRKKEEAKPVAAAPPDPDNTLATLPLTLATLSAPVQLQNLNLQL